MQRSFDIFASFLFWRTAWQHLAEHPPSPSMQGKTAPSKLLATDRTKARIKSLRIIVAQECIIALSRTSIVVPSK
jgi:hypothetical protein